MAHEYIRPVAWRCGTREVGVKTLDRGFASRPDSSALAVADPAKQQRRRKRAEELGDDEAGDAGRLDTRQTRFRCLH